MEQKRILLVDDEPFFFRILRAPLEAEGYRVDTAENGAFAWASLRRGGYDVLITDLIMPGMNGMELAWNLRNDDKFADFPIILMHFLDPQEAQLPQKQRLSKAIGGRNRIINKPCYPKELVSYVKEFAGNPGHYYQTHSGLKRLWRRVRRYL